MTRFLNNSSIKPLIYKDKSSDHFFPKKRRHLRKTINGYNAEMLVDICEGILDARKSGYIKTTFQTETLPDIHATFLAIKW